MGKTLRARVAYVDHDPMVAIHGRALLDVDEATTMIEADIRDLAKIFSDLHVSPMLHGDEPVVVLALDVFLFVGAAGDLAVIVETLGQVLPEGCVMAHSHLRSDGPSASRRPWRSSRCTRRLQRLSPCGPASRSATFSVTGGSSRSGRGRRAPVAQGFLLAGRTLQERDIRRWHGPGASTLIRERSPPLVVSP
ncbi:SAM-dependent methyltransferase [Nonomuraea thailandensis]